MDPEIVHQVVSFASLELEVFAPNELRPPKTVGAVRMTGLARRRKEQDGLSVLVLQPLQRPAVKCWYVVRQLTGRMRVQCEPDAIDFLLQRLRRIRPLEHLPHRIEVVWLEHRTLRKDELKDRVVGNA